MTFILLLPKCRLITWLELNMLLSFTFEEGWGGGGSLPLPLPPPNSLQQFTLVQKRGKSKIRADILGLESISDSNVISNLLLITLTVPFSIKNA